MTKDAGLQNLVTALEFSGVEVISCGSTDVGWSVVFHCPSEGALDAIDGLCQMLRIWLDSERIDGRLVFRLSGEGISPEEVASFLMEDDEQLIEDAIDEHMDEVFSD